MEIIKETNKGFMCLIHVMICGSYKTVLYCSRRNMQKSCHLKQCSFSLNFYEEKVVLTIISLWINLQYIQKKKKSLKTKLLFKINFWATVSKKKKCSGCDVLDVTLQRGKENHKFIFLYEEINAWKTFWNINKLTIVCSETPFQ